MTQFEQRINDDLKTAMKAKDKDTLRTLRSIKSAILLANTDGSGEEVTEEKAVKILTKMAKQRKDSLAIYKEQGRDDLAAIEEVELAVIERYLPKQLTEAELHAELQAIITQVGASSMKDMGQVMGVATQQLAGRAEGKAISAAVKQLLG